MKVCYIAHPISGDLENNLAHLFKTIYEIQKDHPDVYAFAPYITDAITADPSDPAANENALRHCRFVLDTFPIDEVWLTGDKISPGMALEREWALKRGLPVVHKIGVFKFDDFE